MIRTHAYHFIVLAFCFIILNGCAKVRTVENSELSTYINDAGNGVKQEMESNGINYSLKYKPIDLIIQQELRSHSGYNKDSLRSAYSDCRYFVLSISYDNQDLFSGRSAAFESLLKKISFELKNDILLEENQTGELFYLTDFIYPRLYGSTPSTSTLLCFKNDKLKALGDFTIYVNDFVNGTSEKLKFRFNKIDIDNIPALKI